MDFPTLGCKIYHVVNCLCLKKPLAVLKKVVGGDSLWWHNTNNTKICHISCFYPINNKKFTFAYLHILVFVLYTDNDNSTRWQVGLSSCKIQLYRLLVTTAENDQYAHITVWWCLATPVNTTWQPTNYTFKVCQEEVKEAGILNQNSTF